MAHLLGIDVGSSSIKATLLDSETGTIAASASSPEKEMEMIAHRPGWAEQDPNLWWNHVRICASQVRAKAPAAWGDLAAIGISYQMHGLVVVDKNREVLRPSILWCDSRAVEIGAKAAREIGEQHCLENLLNFPGNFTASKLRWVKENEPDIYTRIYKAMLPGDFIAMKLSGGIVTTPSGLSEGILWDYKREDLSTSVLEYYGISPELLPAQVPTFSIQGELGSQAASELGLRPGVKIAYRAGDQPNNAFSLNVLEPGELATTAGTSGVVYGIIDQANYDPRSRVNTFVHVNHTRSSPRYGVLLCVNGTGILNSWLKHNFFGPLSYEEMNSLASEAPIGSNGLRIIPFGNGAERILENKNVEASLHGWSFNTQSHTHVLRAAQEGIAFALNYGVNIMRDMGLALSTIRAGEANLFLSPLFREIFATLTGARLELYNTDGSQGAARGAGVGAGIYSGPEEAFVGLQRTKVIEPQASDQVPYREAYSSWCEVLSDLLETDSNIPWQDG